MADETAPESTAGDASEIAAGAAPVPVAEIAGSGTGAAAETAAAAEATAPETAAAAGVVAVETAAEQTGDGEKTTGDPAPEVPETATAAGAAAAETAATPAATTAETAASAAGDGEKTTGDPAPEVPETAATAGAELGGIVGELQPLPDVMVAMPVHFIAGDIPGVPEGQPCAATITRVHRPATSAVVHVDLYCVPPRAAPFHAHDVLHQADAAGARFWRRPWDRPPAGEDVA